MATPLAKLVLSSVSRYPHLPALNVQGNSWTYVELLQIANQIAGGLQRLSDHLDGEIRCALAVDKSVAGYGSIIATQLNNMAWVPLSESFPVERNISIVEQSQAAVLVITSAFATQAEALVEGLKNSVSLLFVGWEALPIWIDTDGAELIKALDADRNSDLINADRVCSLAYVMFTSGSTGLPKGVAVSQDNVIAYLKRMQEMYEPGCEDRFSQFFEFTFDLSVHDLFLCWGAGACLYAVSATDKLMPAVYVKRNQLSFWFSVPTMASQLYNLRQLKENSMPSLKHVLFCGEALMLETAKHFSMAAKNAVVDNLYGPTEATIAFTASRLSQHDLQGSGVACIGEAFTGLEAVIIDCEGNLCINGEKGELLLGGDQLAQGYWGRPDLVADRFTEATYDGCQHHRWYRTGDVASRNVDGGIQYHGRLDDQVKIRGYRIELQEIEKIIMTAPNVSAVAAVALYDDSDTATGIAVYVVAPEQTAETLMVLCETMLPPYMCPENIHFLKEMPTNTSGKIDRKSLRSRVV